MELKQKTIKGFFWSFIDNFTKLGVQFIVGIILARILSPREFGLIGMLTIFIAVSQTFVDSGFSSALIRKKSCTTADYSTVFYFNLIVAICLYSILYFTSGLISNFFDEPQLQALLKVLGLGLIFSAFGIIQRTILTREINFKVQTNVTIVASLGSGVIAITMAAMECGVWSLVALTLSRLSLSSIFLWLWSDWKPSWIFSKQSFNQLFSFGSKVFLSGLLETVFNNIYYLVIGKYFSAQELGFYTRADQFKNLPSKNITNVIQRVSYPVLSSIQDEPERLRTNFKKLMRSTMFITYILMIGMAAVAKPMVLFLIGEKWLASVSYLQLLCFVGAIYPLNALNINILSVKGRSDIILNLALIKKALVVPVFFIGLYWGIKPMIFAMILQTTIAFILNSFWAGRLINYSTWQQIVDLVPTFLIAILINGFVYFIGSILVCSAGFIFVIQILCGGVIVVLFGELFKISDYLYLKNIVLEQFNSIRSKDFNNS